MAADRIKDPVCGMPVQREQALSTLYKGEQLYFCSNFCRQAFMSDPEKYAGSTGSSLMRETDPLRRIAYFSMEVGLSPEMSTYGGGLGILAGDTLKSAADLKIPLVAVSLLNARGYLRQELDEWGNQHEHPDSWDPSRFATKVPVTIDVQLEGQTVTVGAWQFDVLGITGFSVPLLLLDTDLETNEPRHRDLTYWLYGGDDRYRLAQEVILGIGGVRMLRALGYTGLNRFHMNEGHAALLIVELLRETGGDGETWEFDTVRQQCVFTTHTPVAAGHDQFSWDLVQGVLGEPIPLNVIQMLGGEDRLNMTLLALNASHYVNGVAKKHGEVSQSMFPDYPIESITNGIHSRTWTADSFQALYDRYVPGWTRDPFSLRSVIAIPGDEIWEAHVKAKQQCIEEIQRRAQVSFDPEVLTIGFARRATPYKRADLVVSDPEQLATIARDVGPLQLVFAGKAHPRDGGGRDVIRKIVEAARHLNGRVNVVWLPDYDMTLGKLLTSGVDLWLNTPLPPLEASGTSGMKSAHNGVPSLSILDGWWIEGHLEGITGWSIGTGTVNPEQPGETNHRHAQDLYHKLRTVVVPTFYQKREQWIEVMRLAIALNASFFNTHRMLQQYVANAYV